MSEGKLETYSQFEDLVKMYLHMMVRGAKLPPDVLERVVERLAETRAPDPKTAQEWAGEYNKSLAG